MQDAALSEAVNTSCDNGSKSFLVLQRTFEVYDKVQRLVEEQSSEELRDCAMETFARPYRNDSSLSAV